MKKRVLVVDDSDIVLSKATEALTAAGFTVFTAESAAAADGTIYGAAKPDLIIIDVMMPQLDGDKKAKILKGDTQVSDIPILLMSTKSEGELARLVTESGADGFVRKPFVYRELIEKIEETLQR